MYPCIQIKCVGEIAYMFAGFFTDRNERDKERGGGGGIF